MKITTSLKSNREFRRLYAKGKSRVTPLLVVYCRKNSSGKNRLGITVGVKTGKAAIRNKVRRRIREIYRLGEGRVRPGYDIVVVARVKAAYSSYSALENALLGAFGSLGLLEAGV